MSLAFFVCANNTLDFISIPILGFYRIFNEIAFRMCYQGKMQSLFLSLSFSLLFAERKN